MPEFSIFAIPRRCSAGSDLHYGNTTFRAMRVGGGLACLMALLVLLAGCGGAVAPAAGSGSTMGILAVQSAVTFPLMVAGATGTAQSITVSNTGTAAISIGGISIVGTDAGNFSETTSCGASIPASGSCTVTLNFTAAAAGSYTASLNIANSVSTGGSATVALSGSAAVPTMTLSATAVSFPAILTGVTSPAQSLTLTNTGTVAVTIGSITIGGANSSAFSETTTCGATLAAGASCSVALEFATNTAGSDSGTLTIADNTSAGTAVVSLAGTATAPVAAISLSASALAFSTAAESTSASQTVTVSNTGTAPLNITSITLGGANTSSFTENNTCGATLAEGANCTITASFTPFLATSYSANVAIANSATSGASTIALTGSGTGAISLNTSSSTNWIIDNGAVTLNFDPTQFHVFGIHLAGDANNLVDTTNLSSKDDEPLGLYMGNQGLGAGTFYTGSQFGGTGNAAYLDVWAGEQSSATNCCTYEMHLVVTANDPGVHSYYVLKHSATDIAGSIGLVVWQFRTNLNLFTHSYDYNSGLNNLGAIDTPLPSATSSALADPGRAVQNAVTEVYGMTDAATQGFITATGRGFYTKYDYCTYEYLHQGQGVYGPAATAGDYGIWNIVPRTDTIAGGPTKQDVDTLTSIIQQEMSGAHFVGALNYVPEQGVATTKVYGPVYYRFNKFTSTNSTPYSLYQEAMSWLPSFDSLYDSDTELTTASSYVPSTGRGSVSIKMSGIGNLAAHTAWAVLGDPGTNFQFSGQGVNANNNNVYSPGYQYWADISANGVATISGVVPGTYRLSVYVLGEWGEFRQENVVVTGNATTVATGTFVPENFGTTVFTMGTPDRSSHEFLHGEDANGHDDRNYWGQFNYWQDFAANKGAAVYYATDVGTTPATNDLTKWNYVHWGGGTGENFDPPLFGEYACGNTTDDTTDGYTCAIPAYVAALSNESGTNGVTTPVPNWQIHFATPANFASNQYVTLSVAVACAYGSYVIQLNSGTTEIWHYANSSDCMIRSGLSGYTQWFVMQWPTSQLNQTVGGDNLFSIGMSEIGSEDDAIRLELSNTSAAPATTGWNDYEYIYGGGVSQYVLPNDVLANP